MTDRILKLFDGYKEGELYNKICEYFDECYEDMPTTHTYPVEVLERTWKSGDKEGETKYITLEKTEIVTTKVRIKTPTRGGLCLYLDSYATEVNDFIKFAMSDEATEKHKKIHHILRQGKAMVEVFLEEQLIEGKSATGAIFNLKSKHGRVDKHYVDLKGALTSNHKVDEKDLSLLKQFLEHDNYEEAMKEEE